MIREIPWDLESGVSLFSRWRHEPYAFLLESVEGGETWGRYSFMGVGCSLLFRSHDRLIEVIRAKKIVREECDPLVKLRSLLPARENQTGARLQNGLVGYVGYDAVRLFERLPERTSGELGLPEFYFMVPQTLLTLDNLRQTLEVSAQRPSQLAELLRKLDRGRGIRPLARTKGRQLPWRANLSRSQYEDRVRRVKDYIVAGDVTQTVLSLRFEAPWKGDPFEVYRRLRRLNPSPYLYYLKLGDLQVVGASPETMIRLDGRQMTLRPIAGTRKRGGTEEEDRRLADDLLRDPKERAEHIMLVDLGRNDLGRVAESGSVVVDQLMGLERYSHVMHLVSNVRARLQEGRDAFDLLRAVFPAGTLTGSPKIRAMEIIEELEPIRRGIYGGSVGYFSSNGNMDMAITIRSAVFYRGRIYVQAGAGIVADSDPSREYEECVDKAKAMIVAVEGE